MNIKSLIDYHKRQIESLSKLNLPDNTPVLKQTNFFNCVPVYPHKLVYSIYTMYDNYSSMLYCSTNFKNVAPETVVVVSEE